MPGGVAGIDEEIAVHFRDLRPSHAQAAAAGGVDQFPGAVAGRILEGRAAGLFADRLRGFAMVLHLVHPRADLFRRFGPPTKARRSKNDRGVDAAVAVDEFHAGIVEVTLAAVAADAGRLHQDVFRLAAIGAGIHAQRAADAARNTEIEFEPADIGG